MANSKKKVGAIPTPEVPTPEIPVVETPVVVPEKNTTKKEKAVIKTVEGHKILTETKVNGMFEIKTEDGLGYTFSKEEYELFVK